jgi:NADPH-dependent 2,4-dienoyl-CoA reductase/sulfur reductase-like enzyme
VLVVGASLGGLSVAEALRREGYAGSLVLLGAERRLPYDRPFVAAYGLHGKVTGVLTWNIVKQNRYYRRHVIEGTAWNDASLRSGG